MVNLTDASSSPFIIDAQIAPFAQVAVAGMASIPLNLLHMPTLSTMLPPYSD